MVDVAMAEQLLDGSDVPVVLEQMGGEGVAQRVTGRVLGDTRVAHGVLDRSPHDRLVQVMSAALAVERST